MVLCAGFGTRLRPLTDRVPKPLVPLCGVPLLRYNLALLKNAGVTEVVINTHHLGAKMEKGAQKIAAELSLGLAVSREEKHILGTGGGCADRKSTRLNSSHMSISYAVFCLKKKKKSNIR